MQPLASANLGLLIVSAERKSVNSSNTDSFDELFPEEIREMSFGEGEPLN